MKIKTKLILGVGILFLLISILSILSTHYINTLKSDTENILMANYNSLKFSKNMLSSLNDSAKFKESVFLKNLEDQEDNATEKGEKELNMHLKKNFNVLLQNPNESTKRILRQDILSIINLNMQAIQLKSDLAKKNASVAVVWIAFTASFCLLIALVMLFNLPAHVANPIQILTQSIQQISQKNYHERVHFDSSSEYGSLAKSFNTMAQKLQEYNESSLAKVMMEKKRIETLINTMNDPVIGLDELGIILFANEKALELLNLKKENILAENAHQLAESNDLLRNLIHNIQDTTINKQEQKPIKIYSNQKECYFQKEIIQLSIVPTGEEHTKIIGNVIILRNITTYKELDEAKTNFIATVSHEFKTPISSINLSLQLLKNPKLGDLNPEQSQLLQSIHEDTNRLLKITSELLNMSQVESGKIQLNVAESDPKELLQYAINANKTALEQKRLKLNIQCEHIKSNVYADAEKSAWILTNLISNAIRYSYEQSEITLTITENEKKINFIIQDQGQGIIPQYKEKIFERYFRVPGSQNEGTGLGLAISKEFIEAQNGNIYVESELGVGSTFTITLPKVINNNG